MKKLKNYLFIFLWTLFLSFTFSIETYAAVSVDRLSGSNRYTTSLAVCRNGWTKSSTVIIASGENFPDALSATPLAKMYGAPILLIKGDDWYGSGPIILNELKRLETSQVIIVGGYGVIPSAVEDSLKSNGISYTRLGGKDRYETSVLINKKLETTSDKIVLTTGEDFADALSISTIAAKNTMPIVLVPKGNVPDSVKSFLNGKQMSKTYVLGGQDIISDDVVSQFSNPERILGNNKYERNIAILNEFSNDINFDTLYFASGNVFADALSGSALASKAASPIILISDPVDDSTKKFINDNITKLKNSVILGGIGSIQTSIIENLGDLKEVTYLTDIAKPNTSNISHYMINNDRDKSLDNSIFGIQELLTYSNQVYNKGIRMVFKPYYDGSSKHNDTTELSFDINQKFSKLTGLIFENNRQNSNFNHYYINVYVDNNLKQKIDYKKGDSAAKIDVDITNGAQVRFEFIAPADYNAPFTEPSFDLLNPIVQ